MSSLRLMLTIALVALPSVWSIAASADESASRGLVFIADPISAGDVVDPTALAGSDSTWDSMRVPSIHDLGHARVVVSSSDPGRSVLHAEIERLTNEGPTTLELELNQTVFRFDKQPSCESDGHPLADGPPCEIVGERRPGDLVVTVEIEADGRIREATLSRWQLDDSGVLELGVVESDAGGACHDGRALCVSRLAFASPRIDLSVDLSKVSETEPCFGSIQLRSPRDVALANLHGCGEASPYELDLAAAHPGSYGSFTPDELACPESTRLYNPIVNARYGEPKDALAVISTGDLRPGQIVPFEILVGASDAAPDDGAVEVTVYWDTARGFDASHGVLCAFVDLADPATDDADHDMAVEIVENVLVDGAIQGTFRISGVDPGDSGVIEVWTVLSDATAGDAAIRMTHAKSIRGDGSEDAIKTGDTSVTLDRDPLFGTISTETSGDEAEKPAPPSGGTVTDGSVDLPGTDFEASDGNLVMDLGRDWEQLAATMESGTDLPTGQTDDSFKGGSKEDTLEPGVSFGSIPNNKSDLTVFYIASEKLQVGLEKKVFLYLAWERANTLGTANIDFEFNQSETMGANGVTPVRSDGDMLVTYQFGSGGNVVEIGLSRWVTNQGAQCESNGGTPPCWGSIHPLDGAVAEASFNAGTVYEPFLDINLEQKTFGEAAINLTDAGVFSSTECINFGSAFVKSRSSDSFTSSLKDFIAPISVNVSNCGGLTIKKQTIPAGAAGSFDFTSTGGLSPAAFALSHGGEAEFLDVLEGSYTVTESDPTSDGFELTDISCLLNGQVHPFVTDLSTGTVDIPLAAGDAVECTYTNTQKGTIVIEKQTEPGGDPTAFTFSGDVGGSLADGQTSSVVVSPGTYTSTETVPAGWDLTGISCSDADSTGDLASATATFVVAPGETVTCTFTNTQKGTIVIEKQTDPDGDPTAFTFSGDVGGSLADGQTSSVVVSPGTYTSTETVPAGWDLTGISCSDADSTGDLASATATFVVAPGETVTCTFSNTKKGAIVIEKQTDPDGDPTSFSFSGDVGGSLADGQTSSATVSPGTYTSTETVPPGWELTSISCSDADSTGDVASATATFVVAPGETVTCTFLNTGLATITVLKKDDGDPAALLPGVTFALWNDTDPDDADTSHDASEDVDTGMTCVTAADGSCSFQNVMHGAYWIVETAPPAGHDHASDQKVDLGPGGSVTLEFVNTRQFTIIVLVCRESDDSLYPSTVTLDGEPKTSLSSGGGGTLTDAQLCALAGARYEDKNVGTHAGEVDVPE